MVLGLIGIFAISDSANSESAPGVMLTPAPPVAAAPGGESEAALAQAEMPERDLRDLALRLNPDVTSIPLVVNPTPPTYQVGDTAEFWISNNDTQENRQITAELRYITDHLYMWVEQGVQLDQADLERSAERFETQTYPTNREFFGSEWSPGVDNDVHLTILHARGLGETVAGYYSSADEFSQLINPYSNEREMFYISVDSGSAKPNSSFYDDSLAHEFQHMIHWANDRNEDSWVNEGMAMLAEHLNSFDSGGADIAYTEQPDTQLTTWSDPSEGNGEHYGASYLFMAYFLDRFGEELTKAVVASPENGVAGFNSALEKAGRPERFDDIFADWVIANYLDRPEADSEGRYGYTELDPDTPSVGETYQRFPASANSQVSQYGADYVRLKGQGDLTIEFQGQQQVGLVDAQPKGTYAWWSNRGDDSDATLTRAFDLRDLTTATLTFSAWYDIEEGWDYAYVEVSTDGGARWQILPARYTTDENPVGNAFGVGWTGMSGGGSAPAWVDEQVDLTSFTGQEILLRFEYVTDDAVNKPGFLLDDIAIPEPGYSDGGEAGSGGWEAAGWVLTDNLLQQRWLVQLLGVGRNQLTLQRMTVGADGRGRLTLDGLGDLNEAVLVISALTPVTTEPAAYDYTITAR
ncbi:MAG: hypothetical protein CVU38_02850 [Chloroflexi bacterium HGW-Chloroflexi-1]|nr:MAG: hypothetical protein CVU38_02850 [Chloroflexi bacterium HGW-Chloroflexi-1]